MSYIFLSLLLLSSASSELLADSKSVDANSNLTLDQKIEMVKGHLISIHEAQTNINKNTSVSKDDKSRLAARTTLRTNSLQAFLDFLESTKKLSDIKKQYEEAVKDYRKSALTYLPLANNKLLKGVKEIDNEKRDYTDKQNKLSAAYSALIKEQNNNNTLYSNYLMVKHSEHVNGPSLTAQIAERKANTVFSQLAQQVSNALVAASPSFEMESAF